MSYETQCFQLQHRENNNRKEEIPWLFIHASTQLSQRSQQELLLPLLYLFKKLSSKYLLFVSFIYLFIFRESLTCFPNTHSKKPGNPPPLWSQKLGCVHFSFLIQIAFILMIWNEKKYEISPLQNEIKNTILQTMALFQVKQLYVFTCAVGVSHQYIRFPRSRAWERVTWVNEREPRKRPVRNGGDWNTARLETQGRLDPLECAERHSFITPQGKGACLSYVSSGYCL